MRPTRARRARRAALLGLLLAGLAAALFLDHARGRTTFPFDFPMTYYTVTAYWTASLQAGEWPHWLPYQSMGQPLITIQSGMFYAPLWAFPALGWAYTLHAATVVQVLHVLAGAVGCALLARARFRRPLTCALAGVAWLGFGGLYTNAQHPDIVRAFALTPWVLWTLTWPPGPRPARALLAPGAVALFITGAYPGAVIAGLPLFALFCLSQRALDRDRRALAWQAGLVALGVALAAVMLLPSALAAPQLVRAAGAEVARKEPWFLRPSDLLGLLFSSRAVHASRPPAGDDLSMFGLQLPILLVPFLAFVTRRRARALLPLLVVGGAALLLCFEPLRPLSSMIRSLVPPLGLSRFPVADCRAFVALAALFVALAGVEAFAASRRRVDADRLRAALVLSIMALALGGLVALLAPAPARAGHLQALALQAIALVGAHAALGVRRGRALDPLLVGLTVVSALPVTLDLRPCWSDPTVEARLYDARGVPLREGARLRVASIFERALERRPARSSGRDGLPIRGWVDGSFMTLDYGGSITLARARITSDPALLAFMLEPGALVALDGDDLRSATREGFSAAPVRYARNEVAYDVRTDRARLVVENEVFAPGWTATLEPAGAHARPYPDGPTLEAVPVNGALRGWRVPAGEWRLVARYETPGLRAGAAISALALLAWLLLVTRAARRRPSTR